MVSVCSLHGWGMDRQIDEFHCWWKLANRLAGWLAYLPQAKLYLPFHVDWYCNRQARPAANNYTPAQSDADTVRRRVSSNLGRFCSVSACILLAACAVRHTSLTRVPRVRRTLSPVRIDLYMHRPWRLESKLDTACFTAPPVVALPCCFTETCRSSSF